MIGAGVGATVGGNIQSSKAQKAATSAAKKAKAQELATIEKQAGEYYDLTQEQMYLQAQMANIKSLTDLMVEQDQQPQVMVLPEPAKELSPIDQINAAIDRLLRSE
jgi:hypothetical protein